MPRSLASGAVRARRTSRRLTLSTLEAREVPAAFTQGNIVVLRVGDGGTALSGSASPLFLDEFSPSGTAVFAGNNESDGHPLPTTPAGSNFALTTGGIAITEGSLSLSTDGQYLVVAGYDAAPGTANVTLAAGIGRVVGRVDAAGAVNTSTRFTDGPTSVLRSAVSVDGTAFWTAGVSGIRYVTLGAASSAEIASTDVRSVRIFGGQMYVSSGTAGSIGINTVGTGLPTTGGQPISLIPLAAGSSHPTIPLGFTFLDRDANIVGHDTLYVVDRDIGVLKYSFDGSAWTARGLLTGSYNGIVGQVVGSSAEFYLTSGTEPGNALVRFTDSEAYNATIAAGSPSTLAQAGPDQVFRGVAFAPFDEGANRSPVNTLPATFATEEDASGTLAGISVADPDAGTADVRVTLSIPAAAGVLRVTAELPGGVTASQVSGSDTNAVTITAPVAAINATLANAAGLMLFPAQHFNGSVTLGMVTDDLGNTGTGGARTDTDAATIEVAAVNDAPVASVPGDQFHDEDTTLTFSPANGNGITVADVDAGANLELTLTATAGTVTLGGTTGLTGVTGNGSAVVTAIGSPADLTAALGGLVFAPDQDFNGQAGLRVLVDDQGSSGAGGPQTHFMDVIINVAAVNDAPVLGDYAFDLTGAVSVGTVVGTVSATDPEDDDVTYSITAGDPDGKFSIDPGTGAIAIADPNGLALDYTLTVTATENGPPGASDTGTVTVHWNTAPTGTIPNQTVDEDAAAIRLDLATFYSDAEQSAATLTYAVTNNTNAGLFASVAVQGTSLVLTPAANANGVANITIQATDADGATGQTTFAFTINPVPDVPTIDTSYTPMLPPIKMPIPRNAFPAGAPIADLVEHASDADGQTLGVAVTAADTTGRWQYTTDATANLAVWTDFPAGLSEATPLLLPNDGRTQVRFLPNKRAPGVKAFPKGFAGLSYRAWDGSTDLSAQLERAWVAVGKTAPTVDADGHPLVKAIREDVRQSPAYTVKSFLGLLAKEQDPTGVFGIALTGTTGTGAWEYNTGKSGWLAVEPVGDSAALLLRPTDRVRFKPARDFDGDARLTYHTWVPNLTEFGTRVNLTAAAGVGTPTETAILDVIAVNDRPVVSAGPDLGSVPAGQTTAAQTVATFLSGLVTDVDGPALGIQLLPASAAVGKWQYKDGAGTWVDVKRATTLSGSTEIRFAATARAGTYSLSFKAWDGTPKSLSAFSKVAKATLTITL